MSTLEVTPLEHAPFGARVALPVGVTDPSKLSPEDFAALKAAVETHLVVVVPNQEGLQPQSQYELTQRFDPCQGINYGHKKEIFQHKDSVLGMFVLYYQYCF